MGGGRGKCERRRPSVRCRQQGGRLKGRASHSGPRGGARPAFSRVWRGAQQRTRGWARTGVGGRGPSRRHGSGLVGGGHRAALAFMLRRRARTPASQPPADGLWGGLVVPDAAGLTSAARRGGFGAHARTREGLGVARICISAGGALYASPSSVRGEDRRPCGRFGPCRGGEVAQGGATASGERGADSAGMCGVDVCVVGWELGVGGEEGAV